MWGNTPDLTWIFFSHYCKGIWNIFPTHILMFGDLKEFSLENMKMFKVASTWPSRELQPLWYGLIINNKIIWARRNLKDHLILTPKDLWSWNLPWVSYSFVQAVRQFGSELISWKPPWLCLYMMQSHFWLQRDTFCHFSLGSFRGV